MGNYRFKLSGMMPSAWFYKLRDMGRARNKKHTTHHSQKKNQSSSSSTTQLSKPKQAHRFNARKSYYSTRELNPKVSHSSCHEPPRKPSKRTANNRTPMIKSYSLPGHSSSPFDSSTESEFPEPEFRTDSLLLTEAFHQTVSWPSKSCSRSGLNYTADDIVIDVDKSSTGMKDVKLSLNGYDSSSDFEPPLITIKKKETKPRSRMSTHEEPNTQNSLEVKTVKEDAASIKGQRITHINRLTVSSPGVKLRTNSPRTRKIQIQTHDGRSVSSSSASSSRSTRRIWDSLAIAKRSWDPETDFRESMVEMIVENKMRASKDLEDLLARYLYLNSEEYHELIIKVFKQIWSDLRDTREAPFSKLLEWWKTCVRDSFRRAGYDYDEETFEKIFIRINASFGSSAPYTVFPDSQPFLRWVRQKGVKVGIVSNAEHRYRDVILPAFGIKEGSEWDFGVFSGIEGVEKPNPKIFEIALERAGNIAPKEVLHIGDSMRKDYEPARSIGMHALLLDRFKTRDAMKWRKAGATVLPDLLAAQKWLSSGKSSYERV